MKLPKALANRRSCAGLGGLAIAGYVQFSKPNVMDWPSLASAIESGKVTDVRLTMLDGRSYVDGMLNAEKVRAEVVLPFQPSTYAARFRIKTWRFSPRSRV